jgi:hypothetical protein
MLDALVVAPLDATYHRLLTGTLGWTTAAPAPSSSTSPSIGAWM